MIWMCQRRLSSFKYAIPYLVHLEGGGDGLNQDGAPDGAALHANVVLGQVEDVVPQACLEMRLHLGQVEVRPRAALDQLMCVVEEVEAEVEEAARDGLAVDSEVLLLEMPAAGAGDERGEGAVGAQLVLLLALLEVDLLADGVVEVQLAVDHVVPCRRARIWGPSVLNLYSQSECSYPRSRPCTSRRSSSGRSRPSCGRSGP